MQKIDESKLTKEQQQVLKVFKGELDQTEIKGIDLNDLYILEQGTRHAGAKKILVKHYGEESTGGLTNDELINMSEVIKNGSVLLESFERLKNGFRYAYEWENNGVKLRLVVDDLNDGNKIFDFYSDRNFKDFRDARPQPSTSKDSRTQPTTLNENNNTQKPLTDQEDLLKTSENLNETTQEATQNAKNLSPLEQANAEKLAKLQHAITPLKEFGKNYPEFALKPKEALEKLLQEKNGQVAGAALKYHIKRALERSHSISDFSKNLELSAKNAKFSNNTLKIIEELNNGVKQASDEIKEATKPSNLVKSIREQDTRPFEVIEDKEAFFKDLNKNLEANATPLPKGMSVEEFKQSLESVENKDRFLEHLETRDNSQDRLKFLSLIEPIIREPHIEIFIKDKDGTIKKEYIKAFKDENKTRLYMLITQDNDTILRTFIPKLNERYMRNHVRNADIIHSFIQPNRTAKSDNALSDVVVYGDNNTQKPLTDQEDLLKTSENLNETTQKATNLSPLEQANAEKLAKLESEKLESEKEFTRLKEQEQARKAALKKKLEHERGNAGNIESQTKIEVGEDIPTHTQAQIPKSRVRLNEREIYDLDYAIVKAKDLKPSFTTGGTQKRTDMNEEQIKSIAENFDPKKIFGSGGFEDLPIILHDGQVIAGNHRIQGMLNFTPKSRFAYERAIKEYYHIDLKPDELLVRVPHNRLNNTEINNLAASSNQGRFNSESDHAIAVLSHYEPKLKELETQLNADSIYSLKNIVAKNLNFDKATHPNVTDSNLALLMFNMPRTKTQGVELLNRWQKEFSNDIKSYEKVKKMFVDNAGSFHNLIHDLNFPNVSLNAYLSDIMDRSFANLKNYQSTSESLQSLSEKFYKTSSLEMFEKSDQSTSDISEILGGAIARFARFDDPSKALFEALRSENIKKGLKEFKIADVTKDMFNHDSKEFKDIDIYDFTHYLLMVNREPNETNPSLKRLIEAVKDMQKESEKGLKEVSKKSAEKTTEKGIKERAFKVIEDKEAFLKDLNAIKPTPLPKKIDTDSFLNAFNGVKNKENFIKHLKSKPNAKRRLAYLNLVEPTLKEPDFTLIFKEQGKEVKKEHIKAFQGDPKTIYYFLVTQDNDSKLITGLKVKPIYIKAEIDKADIIHSFIPQARTP